MFKGETSGGREQKAGDEAEDPQGAREVRVQNPRHRQAPGERAGGAGGEPDPGPRQAEIWAPQDAGGGGGHQEEVSPAEDCLISWYFWSWESCSFSFEVWEWDAEESWSGERVHPHQKGN